ncbi:MAG: hypothetical protein ABI981_02650 [Betaproteobacteria bacterium]
MEWILLEAGLALGLAVFIVWFTAGARRKPPKPAKSTESTEANEAAKDRGR